MILAKVKKKLSCAPHKNINKVIEKKNSQLIFSELWKELVLVQLEIHIENNDYEPLIHNVLS